MCISANPSSISAVLLFGPTASGKTALLDSLFIRNTFRFPFKAEVISADSMQVYRGMDIGTAKPDAAFRAALPHHLIDIRNPDEQYTAGNFVHAADTLCSVVLSRGKLPVVSGGTAFYLKNFIFGLPSSPAGDIAVREALRGELAASGLSALREELARRDPESAARIHPNDAYRILRALEITRSTGRPLSSCAVPTSPREGTNLLAIGIKRDRETLYRRIDERTEAMFASGLAGEVKGLIAKGYGPDDPGMKAIGYREFFEMGRSGCMTTADVIELVKRRSRNYAKRQLTFFSSLPGVRWFEADDEAGIARVVGEFAERVFTA